MKKIVTLIVTLALAFSCTSIYDIEEEPIRSDDYFMAYYCDSLIKEAHGHIFSLKENKNKSISIFILENGKDDSGIYNFDTKFYLEVKRKGNIKYFNKTNKYEK